MRIALSSVLTVALLLTISLAPNKASAEDDSDCLYKDEHFHIQDFKADGFTRRGCSLPGTVTEEEVNAAWTEDPLSALGLDCSLQTNLGWPPKPRRGLR